MRWAILCAVLGAAIPADAKRSPPPEEAAPDQSGDFWREVVEPNGDRVRALLDKARQSLGSIENGYMGDSDWAVDQRMKLYRDAYNLMKHARKLSPDNTDVLALLGRTADELGKTRESIEALEACVKLLGPDRAGAEVTGRLGSIYLRLGERDTAIRWLRYAQGPLHAQNTHALVHLANAFAARGEISAAVDTLLAVMPQSFNMYNYMNEGTIVAFALALIYDRDEQRGAAFEVLEKMQSQMQTAYAQTVSNDIAKLRFAPPEDQHYYQALLYESVGHYIEARAEWALYAASTDSPWRARALDHIAAIDHQRRTDPTKKPTQVPAAPGHRPRPHIRRP